MCIMNIKGKWGEGLLRGFESSSPCSTAMRVKAHRVSSCLPDTSDRPFEGSVPVHWLSNVPFNPSSHVNHGRFSARWLSYEALREHGAAARLRDDRGNKDSVAVNSTSPRALNIFYVLPGAPTRHGAASPLFAPLRFFHPCDWCLER